LYKNDCHLLHNSLIQKMIENNYVWIKKGANSVTFLKIFSRNVLEVAKLSNLNKHKFLFLSRFVLKTKYV
jgi:hypothetical protein